MSKLPVFIKKAMLVIMILGIGLAALPVVDVYAAGSSEETDPPVSTKERTALLERIWARQLAAYERQGKIIDNADTLIDRVQNLIDKATEKSLDASAVQEALDAFEAAIQDARPIHQSANGIVTSHKGFDENGKVTDPEQAKETIKELSQHLRDFRATMDGTGKALKDAIREFWKNNRPPRADQP